MFPKAEGERYATMKTISVDVSRADAERKDVERREKRLAELVLTAALRKWRRKEAAPATLNPSQDSSSPSS